MRCFLGCFTAKNNKLELHFQPHFIHNDHEPAPAAVVSRNQLSHLFASQELEEVAYGDKSATFQSADIQCCKEKVIDSDKLPDHTWIPANDSELAKGLDSQEDSPTSCISDPPSASKNSVTANVKSEKENIYDTNNNNNSIASQTGSASGNKRNSNQNHQNGLAEGSMSSSLRQVQHDKVGNKVNIQASRAANGRIGRSPQDRSVLGTITAQWNEEVGPPHAPLKWWDGNGIPNSTNKYREDQIVSWDVTPFEERLEKALSEANSIAQSGKHISGAYATFEEETDTAASEFHSLLHPKSVVSF